MRTILRYLSDPLNWIVAVTVVGIAWLGLWAMERRIQRERMLDEWIAIPPCSRAMHRGDGGEFWLMAGERCRL